MKKTIVCFILLISVIKISGQSSDILILEKDTLNLYSNPLEKKSDWLNINQIISNQISENQVNLSNANGIEISAFLSTYKTEWKIEQNKLFLHRITSYNDRELDLQILSKTKGLSVFANWFNDKLIVFEGKCIVCSSNHLTRTSVYPIETILEFKKGFLTNKTQYKNKILKESFLSSLNPNQYLEYIYSKVKWKELDKLDKKYQVFVSVQPDRNGQIKKIDWKNTYLIFENGIISDRRNPYIKEAIRIAKKIPDFNVVLRHNKIMKQHFSIVFNKQYKEKYTR